MRTLTLKNRIHGNSTVLENEFIDQYMIKANGEYVKVFLLVLRYLQSGDSALTVSKLADCLDCTEKDICRAFKYWAKHGLMKIEYDENNVISGLSIGRTSEASPKVEEAPAATVTEEKPAVASAPLETPAPAKKATPKRKTPVEPEQMRQLYFVAEQYLGKTLTPTDIRKLNFFADELGLSTDLIEYLIEYCVDNNHKSMRYIETVAVKWAEEKVTTVEEAKIHSTAYNKDYYAILNSFGIKGRAPASVELGYIRRWIDEYGMTLDLILEACNRTIENTHGPDFKYADKILKNWLAKDVKHLSDVNALDAAYHAKKTERKRPAAKPAAAANNRFQNFESRSYDISSLEQQLLNVQ